MEANNIVELVLGLYALSCALGLGVYMFFHIINTEKKENQYKERFVKAIEKLSEKVSDNNDK